MMLNQQQDMIVETARRFAAEVLAPGAAERDRDGAYPQGEIAALARLGFMGMLIPEAYGGSDAGFLAYCLALEQIAGGEAAASTIMHVHNLSAMTIARHGTAEQKQRWLPALARGDCIAAFMITEPQAGSDTAALATSARRDGDHWILNGTKQFISNGARAGVAVAVAVSDRAAGRRGVTAFLVDTANPGYRVARHEDKMGQRAADTVQVVLEDCRVPAEAVFGGEGGGYRMTMAGLADGRIAVAAQATGIAQAALDHALGYAQERSAYGAPITALQAVAFRLAEMATQVDVARCYYRHAAALLEAGRPCVKEAAMAKLHASEMAERVCSDAIQTLGGYGYLRDFPVERLYRDMRVTKIYEGTSDIQKLIISRLIAPSG